MLKINNPYNRRFIERYLKQGNTLEIDEVVTHAFRIHSEFEEALKKLPNPQRVQMLSKLISDYSLQEIVRNIFPECQISQAETLDVKIPVDFQDQFDNFMLTVGFKIIGCYTADNGTLQFNKRAFADFIMKVMNLKINLKDPDKILVYNYERGAWEDASQPINRFVIEVAHHVGLELDSWHYSLEKGIYDILRRKVGLVEARVFDQNYFPLSNVSLDSKTGRVVPHAPEHLATFGSEVSYNPHANCPMFETFINELFDDSTTVDFVQEWFGYVLSNSQKANALLIGIGSGANGKSTLFDILAQLVGVSNVSSAPLANFNTSFGLEPLIGMKLNLATESDTDGFKTGKLKALTAGEAISVNRKNKEEITVILPTKLVFLVNELPILSDNSKGFERRLILLPFNKTFPSSKQDKDLPVKLSGEMSGILNWALKGLERLIDKGYRFTTSLTMKAEKEKYFGVGNTVEKFFKECVVTGPAHVLESKDVLTNYKIWMTTKGYPFKGTESSQTFWRMFDEVASFQLVEYSKGKSNGKTVVRDLDLKLN